MNEWEGFKGIKWQKNIDVANFIEMNYEEYVQDEAFLRPISKKTSKLLKRCNSLKKRESISGILDIETEIFSGIDNFDVGYVDRKNEMIVGLQADEPLTRIMHPYSSIDSLNEILSANGFRLDSDLSHKFKEYRNCSEDVINSTIPDEIKSSLECGLLMPIHRASRGYIVGDYRRVALYGVDVLIDKKKHDLKKLVGTINNSVIRMREEIQDQITALESLKKMALRYDIDISRPANNAKEAIEWTYIAYLGFCKQNNGFANSIGRNSTFFDIYIERDIKAGILTEDEAQELVDQFFIKLSLIRHIRGNSVGKYYTKDSNNISECIGGMCLDKSFVTKTSYRFLNTFNNIGLFSEPNLIVLWSDKLPDNFKRFATLISYKTNAIGFLNDEIASSNYNTDYTVCNLCPCSIGNQIVLNGSSINLAMLLLLCLNGGYDPYSKQLIIDDIEKIDSEYLDYDEIIRILSKVFKKAAKMYVDYVNIVHYEFDKYDYESLAMAFNNTIVGRLVNFSITGLANIVDSLSAIKYGKVRVKRNEEGFIDSFDNETDYPHYGCNDDRVDDIALKMVTKIYQELNKLPLYRNATHVLSIGNSCSYLPMGAKTLDTPDGRGRLAPLSVGANPKSGEHNNGVLSTLSSTAKLPYQSLKGGSLTSLFVLKDTLGIKEARINNLVQIIDGYFKQSGIYIEFNFIDKETIGDYTKNAYISSKLFLRIAGFTVDIFNLNNKEKEEIYNRIYYSSL